MATQATYVSRIVYSGKSLYHTHSDRSSPRCTTWILLSQVTTTSFTPYLESPSIGVNSISMHLQPRKSCPDCLATGNLLHSVMLLGSHAKKVLLWVTQKLLENPSCLLRISCLHAYRVIILASKFHVSSALTYPGNFSPSQQMRL